MGIFSSTKITDRHVQFINNFLPEELKVKDFNMEDIVHLRFRIKNFIDNLNSELRIKSQDLITLKEERLFDKFELFNVPLKGKSLGLVDVGIVERFSSKSTGNSFENGMVQYAIENTFEQVWAENNAQYTSVQKAKNQLKHKAMSIYPEANAIENFSITFRELGNSGNVFIYINGTATIADAIDAIEIDNEIKSLIERINTINDKIQNAQTKLKELPEYKELKSELKKL